MMYYKLTLKITFFSLFLLPSLLTASDSTKYKDLEFRLKKIEEYRIIDDKKFENKSKELDLKIEEYKQQKTILDWIALSLGGLTVVSLWGFWQKAKAIAEKKIEEKFDTLLNDKRDQLISVIDNHDKERKLKVNNTIYIVADEKSDTDFLLQFFKKLGFTKTELLKVKEYKEIGSHIKYDILFLFRYQDNNPLSDETTNKYIENSRTDSIVFIFGNHIDLSKFKSRSSSATFWSQLYGNIISAMKYQELLD